MPITFKRYSLCLDDKTYNSIKQISESTGNSIAEVSRELIKKGLAKEYVGDSEDMMTSIVRKQMEVVLKPNIERLARIASKSGHMSATAAFLNVQALMDLIPIERRKDVRTMYEKARCKAVSYMRTKAADFENDI
ncbi:hypothetical protein [Clostridium sp.]|uniref:hypothetical protein n=1 Tax=Clostridium sp. TaxID=1506 RepID=UPI003D6D348B